MPILRNHEPVFDFVARRRAPLNHSDGGEIESVSGPSQSGRTRHAIRIAEEFDPAVIFTREAEGVHSPFLSYLIYPVPYPNQVNADAIRALIHSQATQCIVLDDAELCLPRRDILALAHLAHARSVNLVLVGQTSDLTDRIPSLRISGHLPGQDHIATPRRIYPTK